MKSAWAPQFRSTEPKVSGGFVAGGGRTAIAGDGLPAGAWSTAGSPLLVARVWTPDGLVAHVVHLPA